jgi:translation elongation factor P/translation initiation factor 5A
LQNNIELGYTILCISDFIKLNNALIYYSMKNVKELNSIIIKKLPTCTANMDDAIVNQLSGQALTNGPISILFVDEKTFDDHQLVSSDEECEVESISYRMATATLKMNTEEISNESNFLREWFIHCNNLRNIFVCETRSEAEFIWNKFNDNKNSKTVVTNCGFIKTDLGQTKIRQPLDNFCANYMY